MARVSRLGNALVNAKADGGARMFDNGYIRFFSGAMPTTGDTALSGNTLLAELRFPATSAPAAVAGVLTFNSIAAAAAIATGTVSFIGLYKSDGTTPLGFFNVDVSSGTPVVTIASTSIVAGMNISLSAATLSELKEAAGY